MKKQRYDKAEIMRKSWELFNSVENYSFADCLRAVWADEIWITSNAKKESDKHSDVITANGYTSRATITEKEARYVFKKYGDYEFVMLTEYQLTIKTIKLNGFVTIYREAMRKEMNGIKDDAKSPVVRKKSDEKANDFVKRVVEKAKERGLA